MIYKLISEPNSLYNGMQQVLLNRGLKPENYGQYINTTDEVINDFRLLGLDKLQRAAAALNAAINGGKKTAVIVDSDCDGFTSSALMINYLYEIEPEFVKNHLTWLMHNGKEHGLQDHVDTLINEHYELVICPDGGTNDIEQLKELKQNGITTIVLDHHEVEQTTEAGIIINNQGCNYPNKQLSGVGIVYQFCRYLDTCQGTTAAEKFLDLVALGLMGDMMSMLSIETKHLIWKGFKDENIRNPFIAGMADKNAFSLNKADYKSSHLLFSPMGAAFFIVPFINATLRSGTQEEKDLIFRSMLTHKAFENVLSTKRGHALGEMETVVTQAVRTVTNIKNRQTKAQDEGMALIEKLIESNDMMKHKVLLFLIDQGKINKNIAGLCANKIMGKYQRPCCILTKIKNENDEIIYQGSARGCDKAGIEDFKKICEDTSYTTMTIGHPGAFGLGIAEENIDKFVSATDEALKDMPDEPCYYVDYIFNGQNVDKDIILDIGNMNDYWGKDLDRSYIAIKDLTVTSEMTTIYAKSTNTLKIHLSSGVDLMLFDAPEELCELVQGDRCVTLDIVGRCSINEFYNKITPQVLIEDWQISKKLDYYF